MKTVQMGPISTFKRRATHVALGLGLAATLALGAVMPAMAAPGDGTVQINGGSLSASQAAFAFEAKSLTGAVTALTTTASAPITVVDARGLSAGWHLTMNMAPFTGPGTLVAAPRVTAAPITGGAASSGTVSFADGATVSIAAVDGIIASATAATTSNGTFTVTPAVTIDIPGNTVAGLYTSASTLTIVTAP